MMRQAIWLIAIVGFICSWASGYFPLSLFSVVFVAIGSCSIGLIAWIAADAFSGGSEGGQGS